MRELHHIGIVTNEKKENENYMADAKLYVTDVDASPNKIEWLRFEEGSPMPELLQKETHISYVVPDIKAAMEGKYVEAIEFIKSETTTFKGTVLKDIGGIDIGRGTVALQEKLEHPRCEKARRPGRIPLER